MSSRDEEMGSAAFSHATAAWSIARLCSVAVLIAALVGCADQPIAPADGNHRAPVLRQAEAPGRGAAPPKRLSERISDALPQFGGVFVDGATGSIVVLVTDLAAAGAARDVVNRELSQRLTGHERIDFRRAQFSFRQLEAWHRQLSVVHSISGVIISDVAERYNRVRIGVVDTSLAARLHDMAASKGVPQSALMIVKSPVPKLTARLTDRVRPFRGGTQVQAFYREGGVDIRGGFCTYGVNVDYLGRRHMIVNSHCTQTGVGGYIGASIYQNLAPTYTSDKAYYIVGDEV